MMHDVTDETSALLDEVVKRWSTARRTFTEKEALQPVWDAGHEIPIQADARFVLVHEGDGKRPSHWRLAGQTVANTRLLNELLAGTWDGRDLDAKLAALDAEDGRHYVFYPLDARFIQNRQGILEPAEHERNVRLTRAMKASLDTLGPQLLAGWMDAGGEPWTVRMVTDRLRECGWPEADRPNAWLYVRAWLLSWTQVQRVGQDYWIPAEQIPPDARHTRLQVHPLRMPEPLTTPKEAARMLRTGPSLVKEPAPTREGDESQVALRGEVLTERASWTVRLRTANILQGFLHVPAGARGLYPKPSPGEAQKTVLRGMWHEDGTRFWLWLDRANNILYGPDLDKRLMELYAGTILRIEWAPDMIVFQQIGQDEAVQEEEARLIDLEALAAMRGGLGESYRRSIQAILEEAPQGLTFAEIVQEVRRRQQHEVHRGTIHALLHSGGFVQRDRRWFAAPDDRAGARRLRAALVETLLPAQQESPDHPLSQAEYVRTRVRAIHARLTEIVMRLRVQNDQLPENPEPG
jgi:hypothetical protein